MQGVESFLSEKFSVTAKITEVERKVERWKDGKVESNNSSFLNPNSSLKKPAEKKSAPTKKIPAEKISTAEVESGEKLFGKKITGGAINISDIQADSKVIICGEIGDDDKNGVNFREFKTGSSAQIKLTALSAKNFLNKLRATKLTNFLQSLKME